MKRTAISMLSPSSPPRHPRDAPTGLPNSRALVQRASFKRCCLVFAVLALVGCANTSTAGSGVDDSTNNSAPASPAGGRWDPSTWQPKVQVKLPSLTDKERAAAREEYLERLAPEGITPPTTKLIRWTQGSADYAKTQADCLTKAGFKAEPSPDGQGTTFPEGIPNDQKDAFNLAAYICEAQHS